VTLAYLGLGSNLGDRRENLAAAVRELGRREVRVQASSSVYETEPVGLVLDQPDFYNACLRVETELGPEALLEVGKEVERAVGCRAGGVRHGPRVLDVDLLLFGTEHYRSPGLELPHHDLAERRFVLVPLLELDPETALPDGTLLSDRLAALGGGQAVRRAGPPLV
jgi:2-amino-4-hydroxy-6-hydroxymethyldihydropteridine diphosphokinase